MNHKLTISISEEVYKGLHAKIGARRIGKFLDSLARPHVVDSDIEAGYKAMAEYHVREQEALEWAESGMDDNWNASR